MLIVALALAVVGLIALVTAVITGNELVAWVCIAASSLGVVLLVVDAIRERQRAGAAVAAGAGAAGGVELTEPGSEATEIVETATSGSEAIEKATEIVESSATVEIPDAETLFVEERIALEDHPEEVVHEEPEYDTYSDDEPEYLPSAEEAALHTVGETELDAPVVDEIAEEVAGDIGRPDER